MSRDPALMFLQAKFLQQLGTLLLLFMKSKWLFRFISYLQVQFINSRLGPPWIAGERLMSLMNGLSCIMVADFLLEFNSNRLLKITRQQAVQGHLEHCSFLKALMLLCRGLVNTSLKLEGVTTALDSEKM